MECVLRRTQFFLLIVAALSLSSCASTEEEVPKGKYHQATVVNDLFQVEQGMPIREVKKDQTFFFKRCEVVGRRPYFTKTEYECNQGPEN